MKRLLISCLAALGLLAGMLPGRAAQDTYEEQWKAVQAAIAQGLPRTAITNVEPILNAAMKSRNWPQAARAVAQKIALEGAIEGNKPEERITRMKAEIARAPAEMKPVLQALLGHWYWSYFQQNRWRFLQRTQTAETPGADFTTWALPQLFAEIGRAFDAALADPRALQATPISAWDGFIETGTMPDTYRPTLFDFLAYEALDFWSSGEQAGALPERAFELPADSPALAEAAAFLAWWQSFPLKEFPDSPAVRALSLYSALLKFHERDAAPTLAFAAADLARLSYAVNTAFGEEKDSRYRTALEGFIKRWADFEISALADVALARSWQQEGDLLAAQRAARRGVQVFPGSVGGKECRNLLAQLESKSVRISTERVWPGRVATNAASASRAPGAGIEVAYRNVTNVHFRAYSGDWESFLDKKRRRPENLTAAERRQILAGQPALAWSAALPPTSDLQERTEKLAAPGSLRPGFYFLASSHDPQFRETENVIGMTTVWVSELALVLRTRDGRIEGFVLEADSGNPVEGAELASWFLDPNGARVTSPVQNTDTNGFFSLNPQANRGYLVRVRHAGRALASADDLWTYDGNRRNPREEFENTVFFTDRALYRPGQTVQYKGLCVQFNPAKNSYHALAGETLEVIFRDANNQEIARAKHRANDFGSFAGSFTAPRDRLLGQMHLEATGRAAGQGFIRVEEYKRPKFAVTLDAPKVAARLNEKVSIPGTATSYTGAAVDGATVKWRVTRQVRMPWWWGWWRGGFGGGDAQEIAHGTAKTGVDGAFTVEFTAKADPKVLAKDEPTFSFEISADVTDGTGETRSAQRSVRLGYAALEAMLSAGDWQAEGTPVEIKVTTLTLDGEPQTAEGSVKIHKLNGPRQVVRAPLGGQPSYRGGSADKDPAPDLSDPTQWPLGEVVEERGFTTDTNGAAKLSFALPTGAFRAVVETQDRFGKKVTGRLPLQVLKPESPKLAIRIPQLVAAPAWELQPGAEFMALWGTGYERGRACIEIEHRQKIIQRFWTDPARTQQQIKLAITEALRGGFVLHITQVRENRGYLVSRSVSVPWVNKELELTWEHFVSKLEPGKKESWTLAIRGPKASAGEKVAAELVATLYDASLDAFQPHSWPAGFGCFYTDTSTLQPRFQNYEMTFQQVFGRWEVAHENVSITWRHFPTELTQRFWGFGGIRRRYAGFGRGRMETEMMAMTASPAPAAAPMMDMAVAKAMPAEPLFSGVPARKGAEGLRNEVLSLADGSGGGGAGGARGATGPKLDLSQVAARKNLNETAFFYPQLTTDSNGLVRMTFTMPEALTKWRFLGFASTPSLQAGLLEATAVTAKDIMVQPNPPRFLRERDTIEFTVKISNQSDQPQSGRVKLTFADAATSASLDKALGIAQPEQDFSVPARESRTVAWRLKVPDGAPFLTYKAVASTGRLSDGEEGFLPVLSRRILVTESLPLPIRGKTGGGEVVKNFTFQKLLDSGKSSTLRSQSLTVQMVSQPAWYAVLALPYLIEYPWECSEQTFNRFYANTLARHIANSDPKIRRIFDLWKNTPALDSPLQKNQELKSVMLEETPWVLQAQAESQARRNVGILFDENRLNQEMRATLEKLTQMQLADGRWPWFPGGMPDDFITLYITAGFARLRHLGTDVDAAPAIRALDRLDEWTRERHEQILRDMKNPQDYIPSHTDAFFLYTRSFFLKEKPVAPANLSAVDFFLAQSRKFWLQTNQRMTQGHLALALQRFAQADGKPDPTPPAIMKSLKERSVTNEELGMFWRDTELSWWWYRAPIETQALMIEAFDEVAKDQQAVEDCRVWLLKQKQTQDWKTTKATGDAVYALLLRGKNLLGSDALVEVKLGGVDVTPKRMPDAGAQTPDAGTRKSASGITSPPEPGTGFYAVRFPGAEVKPQMGRITVRKTDEGVSWGHVTWQYLEDMTKVTPYEGTPLKLKKTLFTKVNTAKGPELQPVRGPLAVGDELVVRIELRVDRDMEYLHLRDQRGSGTEPVNVLSGFRFQDGLGYYETTRDAASHFFISYLPKGTYVFEYSTRVQLRGEYQTGMASIQCMYAPEFNSHSESLPLVVK